jgi:outer membrane protein OmpA-like peptidoglycan-associated protein
LSKVAIEGHTDDLGVAEDNQGLSQRRAEAVVKYLTDKGIAAGRLVAEGLGSTKPLCLDLAELLKSEGKNKRKIEACREKNRRVQFRVVEMDGKAVQGGISRP